MNTHTSFAGICNIFTKMSHIRFKISIQNVFPSPFPIFIGDVEAQIVQSGK